MQVWVPICHLSGDSDPESDRTEADMWLISELFRVAVSCHFLCGEPLPANCVLVQLWRIAIVSSDVRLASCDWSSQCVMVRFQRSL